MRNILTIIALLLLAMLGRSESAEAKPLTIRNDSNKKVYFGFAYWGGDVNKWVSKGWWNAEAGNQKQIELGAVPNKIYVFAHDEDGYTAGRYWGGTEGEFCIDKTNAYEINDANKSSKNACGGGTRVRAFTVSLAEVSGGFSWTVNNSNMISSHVNVCNQAGQDTYLASAMNRGASGWKAEGWWKLTAGACKNFRVHSGEDDFPTVTGAAAFNLFAKTGDNNFAWQGSQYAFCFDLYNVINVPNADTRECLEADWGKAYFTTIPVVKGETPFNLTMPSAKPITTTVNMVNQSGRKIWVSRVYYPQDIRSEGWYTVESGATTAWTLTPARKNQGWYQLGYTGSFYWAAHDQNWEMMWAKVDGSQFCVDTTNAYAFTDYTCSGDTKVYHRFQDVQVAPGLNTVSITEANGKKKTNVTLVNDMDFPIYATYAGNVMPYSSSLSSHGYFNVEKKSNRELTLWSDKNVPAQGKFYFYANNFTGGEWSWGSDKEICIHSKKAFDYDFVESKACNEGGQYKIKTMPFNVKYGPNEVRFTAQNANAKTEVEVCNETAVGAYYWDTFTASGNGPDELKKGARTRYNYINANSCRSIYVMDYNGQPYAGTYFYTVETFGSGSWTGPYSYCTSYGTTAEADQPECTGTQRKFRYLASVTPGAKSKIVLNLKTADATTFSFCNQASKAVDAAVSYQYKTGMVTLGLGSIAAGTCISRAITDQDGMPVIGTVYIYARSADGDVYTSGDKTVCVSTEKDRILDTTQTASCSGPNQKLVKVRAVDVQASTENKGTIRDSDALAKTKVQFCNRTEAPVRAAFAYYRGKDGFVSEGWIDLPVENCETKDIGSADDEIPLQNVLVYGETGLETFGQGPLRFCVKTGEPSWTLVNADQSDCRNSSLKRVDATLIQVKKAETYNFDFVKTTAASVTP